MCGWAWDREGEPRDGEASGLEGRAPERGVFGRAQEAKRKINGREKVDEYF